MTAVIPDDLDTFEVSLRLFIQTMKRPQVWHTITAQADVSIDRPAAFMLLLLVRQEVQGSHLHNLAEYLNIEAPSVTRKVQQLEQAGLVERHRDEQDKRSYGLRLTKKGQAIAKRLHEAQRHMYGSVLSHWPATERRQFIKLFERFSQDMANYYNLHQTKAAR